MPPAWLTALSWAALAAAFASTAAIACDIWVRGYRQHMRIMEAVWPVTALYFGPAALAAYRAWGRPKSTRWQVERGEPPGQPGYAVTATGVSHCGAGCTLGDIIAEFAAPHLTPASPVYWFMMQVGMIAGFFTAWPVNAWLIRAGIKEAM